ncbi:hypothetical protein BZA70DRAFT_290633 [Myxozyma melibiosi]|uniref:Ubiquitination network signaling protein n=1 Tax=Myxozyma melibiosi TaxID=54550 RepID=A0ABR1F2L3_9ASCO
MARGSAARRANISNSSASSSSSSLASAAVAPQLPSAAQDLPSPDVLRRPPASSQVHSPSSLSNSQGPATPSKSDLSVNKGDVLLPTTPLHHESSERSLRKSSSFYNEHSASAGSSKTISVQNSILTPHPFIDSLTIFILIIQFPNLIVSFIHILFASLTFVPPPTPPASSLISALTHATQASPSLLTVLFADITVAVISIFFLPRMRAIMVDLGSAVIASALGGGGSKTAIYCTSLLQIARAVRHSFFLIRRGALSPVSSSSTTPFEYEQEPIPPQYYLASGGNSPRTLDILYGSAGWFSQAIAIHIVGQSVMHSLRRMFLRNETRLSSMPAASSSPAILGDGYGIDYEAVAFAHNMPSSTATPSSNNTPVKKKKKTNKEGKHYQQTLWSALANTLVLASRESNQILSEPQPVVADESSQNCYGSSLTADESQSLLSSLISDDNPSANGLGYRPSATEPALYCCVRYILENEVAFEIIPGDAVASASASAEGKAATSLPATDLNGHDDRSLLPTSLVPSIFSHPDPTQAAVGSQPHACQASLYNGVTVRVNGILWPEVSVQTIVPKLHYPGLQQTSEGPADATVQMLENAVADDVEINGGSLPESAEEFAETLLVVSGLTPITEYEIEICKKFKYRQVTICRTDICTSPKDSSTVSSQVQQPSRPLSPVTTLLDTLCTTNETLTEEKQKLKRFRRDHSKHLSALRSEIDALKSRLGTGDRGDERAWRRVLALRESVRRTEEEIETLQKRTVELELEEENLEREVSERRKIWQAAMGEANEHERRLQQRKEAIEARGRELQADESSIAGKCEKLQARQRKLLAEFQRADQERRQAWDAEFKRRKLEREKLAERRHAIEEEFSSAITKMEHGIDDIKDKTQMTWQSVSVFGESAIATAATAVGIALPVPMTSAGGAQGGMSALSPSSTANSGSVNTPSSSSAALTSAPGSVGNGPSVSPLLQ